MSTILKTELFKTFLKKPIKYNIGFFFLISRPKKLGIGSAHKDGLKLENQK